jgi:hypothetical protein
VNFLDDGINTTVFVINGEVTTLTTNELVTLNLRPTGDEAVQLGWPTAVSGYTLQYCTNVASASWQTVTNAITESNMEHTVTVSSTSENRFFRLKK